jgi:P27 family predicted phage terminase small subunit
MSNPRKPTNLRLIEGNKGKRAINKNEPDPDFLNDLTAPSWLSAAAVTVWNEMAPKLRAARLLTKIDVPFLEMGCVALANYRHAAQMLGDDLVLEGSKAEYVNQWMVAQSMAFKQAMAVFQQFGMSPAARTRISINPQNDLFGDGTGSYYFS